MLTIGHRFASQIASGTARRLLLPLAAVLLSAALPAQTASAPAAYTGANNAVDAHLLKKAAVPARKPFVPSLPLFFEKNGGQFDRRAGFLARTPGATLYLTGSDAVLVHSEKGKDRASAVRMHWAGSSSATAPEGEAEMAAKSNYFIGNDQSRWHTNVANFQRVRQSNLYPGVDLVYYGNQQQLEYDLTVQPGASPSTIRLQIEGANCVKLDKATGDLILVDAIGSPLRLLKPVVYQLGDNKAQTSISGAYVLSAQNTVSFVLGDYDHSRPLVIDPEVLYSTMFGGTTPPSGGGYSQSNVYTGMTVDSNGDVYLSGITSNTVLPTTAGAFQSNCNLYDSGQLCSNFFVAKFDPTQSGAASLIYATYIGGNAQDYVYQEDAAKYSIAVDAEFDAYIVGTAVQGMYGSGYPTTSNAYVQTCTVPITGPTCSGVLTKLNPTGSALLYSTWLANAYSLAEPGMVAVDSNQIAYIAGSNGSGSPGNFLAAFNTTQSGAGSFVYSVGLPFGVMAIAADPTGNAYVGGESFHGTENGATGYQLINFNGAVTALGSGDFPGVLVKYNPTGQNVYATFFGDGSFNGANAVWGVAADPDGIAYVTGDDANVVQVNGLPSGVGGTFGAYVAQVDTTQTGPASLLYSTYIYAGDVNNETWAVASNGSGQFAFSGIANSVSGYPVTNPLTQPVPSPTASPSDPEFIGMIDPSKSGQDALIFLSFVDGVDEGLTLFLDQGGNDGGGGTFSRPASRAKTEVEGFGGPPSYNLYVAGYGLSGLTANPFLTGPVLESYSTSIGGMEIAPFFYKIALGPIDCLTVSPYGLAFPSQELTTTSPSLPFTVTNTCASPVPISAIEPSPQFNESDNCIPSLPGGQSCTVNVTFEPTSLSAFNGVTYTSTTGLISVVVTNSNAPLTVAVSGIGVSATTATGWVSPQNIAFGGPPQPDGTVSAPVTVTLTNTGSVKLGNGVNPLIVTSTNFAAFTVNTAIPHGCGTTVLVGAYCQFQVNFAPTTTTAEIHPSQNYTQTVTVNGPNPTISMTLTGTGGPAAPIATLSATTLTFPSTAQGGSNGPQSVTLTNTGSATMTGISVGATAGTDPSSYSVGGSCITTTSLAVGAPCTLSVTFNPMATGTLTASVTITDNAAPSTQTVSFTGTGTPAVVPAALTTPTPTTTLSGTSVTFDWTAGTNVPKYWFNLGTAASGANAKNIYSGSSTTQTSVTISGLPNNGETIYATLYSYIAGTFQPIVYTYTAYGAPTPAVLTTPSPSSTLTNSTVTFSWTTGINVQHYWFNLGTASSGANSKNLYSGSSTTSTSVQVSGLPTNGETIYATLYSYIGGTWQPTVYTYAASGSPTPAALTTPSPSSTLTSSTVTFTWTAGSNVQHYWFNLGTAASGTNAKNLYSGASTTATSVQVSGLPTNGETIYATLYSYIAGTWQPIVYTYTASGSPTPAALTTPTPSTTLPNATTVTFSWSTGSNVQHYWFNLGTSASGANSKNIYSGSSTTATSVTVNNVPTNGETIYATLYSYIGGAWQPTIYTYTTF